MTILPSPLKLHIREYGCFWQAHEHDFFGDVEWTVPAGAALGLFMKRAGIGHRFMCLVEVQPNGSYNHHHGFYVKPELAAKLGFTYDDVSACKD